MTDYPSTRWSLIEPASLGDQEALDALAHDYWGPLYSLAVRMGLKTHEAEDLVQGFFLYMIAGRGFLAMADRQKGTFRAYLAQSFRNFVNQAGRGSRAKKRHPGVYEWVESRHEPEAAGEAKSQVGNPPRRQRKWTAADMESMDLGSEAQPPQEMAGPLAEFERTWALTALAEALAQAAAHWTRSDPRRWRLFMARDLVPAVEGVVPPSYDELCPKLGYSELKKAQNDIVTVKRSVQQNLRAVVRAQVERRIAARRQARLSSSTDTARATASDATAKDASDSRSRDASVDRLVEEELRDLQRILSSHRPEGTRVRARQTVSAKDGTTTAPVSQGETPLDSEGRSASDWLLRFLHEKAAQSTTETGVSSDGGSGGVKRDMSLETPNPAEYDLTRLLTAIREDAMDELWTTSPDELRSLLTHYLSRPIGFVLDNLDSTAAESVRTRAGAQGLLIQSLGDLLRHPHPPVELLEATKAFARAHRQAACKAMPSEVATVLYYASIVAARVGGGERISGLDDDQLRRGLLWVLDQTWINDATRQLIQDGLAFLDRERGGDLPPDATTGCDRTGPPPA